MGVCHAKRNSLKENVKPVGNQKEDKYHSQVNTEKNRKVDQIDIISTEITNDDKTVEENKYSKLEKKVLDFLDPCYGILKAIIDNPINMETFDVNSNFSRILLNKDKERYRYFGEIKNGLKEGTGVLYNFQPEYLMVGNFHFDHPEGDIQIYYPNGQYKTSRDTGDSLHK